jgi:hypothetical protein
MQQNKFDCLLKYWSWFHLHIKSIWIFIIVNRRHLKSDTITDLNCKGFTENKNNYHDLLSRKLYWWLVSNGIRLTLRHCDPFLSQRTKQKLKGMWVLIGNVKIVSASHLPLPSHLRSLPVEYCLLFTDSVLSYCLRSTLLSSKIYWFCKLKGPGNEVDLKGV